MNEDLFTGKLVRLAAHDPEKEAAMVAAWYKDTSYSRLLSVEPVLPPRSTTAREMLERLPKPTSFHFGIRTLTDDKLIGFVSLFRVTFMHGDGFVGIGIGDVESRGKGYGTDALRVLLRFAFQELNLHRVSLDAVATNARAIRSYEKGGFVLEGQTRGTEFRGGVRDNVVAMGVLKREWEAKHP